MKDVIVALGRGRMVLLFTLGCIAISMLITYIAMTVWGDGANTLGLTISIVAPAIIAPTATWYTTGLIIRIDRLEREARKLATYDSLSGQLNRRAFFESAYSVMQVCKRNQTPFSLAYMDFDDFKKINDQYGHAAGDELLRQHAHLIRKQIRGSEILGRVGGEEFALAMANTHVQGALHLAEKVRKPLSRQELQFQSHRLQCSVSIGVATTDWSQPVTFQQLCEQADKALYRAKKSGKNQVTHFDNIRDQRIPTITGLTPLSDSDIPLATPGR